MKILVFTEGTCLMHKNGMNVDREKRVEHVKNNEISVKDYKSYIPIGNVVNKLKLWADQGAEIVYLTSRISIEEIEDIQNVLIKNRFPNSSNLFYRNEEQQYYQLAEKILPDVLIEDDCESIGGKNEMTFTYINPSLKKKIKSIVVKEFEGLYNLPDRIEKLLTYK